MKKKLLKTAIIVIVCIILNVSGRFLATQLDLPLWLDTIGTFVATYLTGLLGGIIAAVANTLVFVITDGSIPAYLIVSVGCAAVVKLFMKKGCLDSFSRAAVLSFWLGIICVIMSTPINFIYCGGYSDNVWGDALFDMLLWNDCPKIIAALADEAVVEIIDKQICALIAFLIVYFIRKLSERKPQDAAAEAENTAEEPAADIVEEIAAADIEETVIEEKTKDTEEKLKNAAKTLTAFLLAFSVLSSTLFCMDVKAAETYDSSSQSIFDDSFVEKIYNNTNGMMSSEANAIGETEDGYIWIGSYAGLTRYDGSNFEFIRDGGLVSIMCMMTDSKGRLWIGTNGSGFAIYNKGYFEYYSAEDGLSSDSVRCFAEDKNGNVYIGTAEKINKYSTDGKIETIDNGITFVKTMLRYEDIIIALDNSGKLHGIASDGSVFEPTADMSGYFYDCADVTSHGITAGTDSGEIFVFEPKDGRLEKTDEISTSAESVSAIYEDSKGRLWIGAEEGFGKVESNGRFYKRFVAGFESSINCMHEDYQGNLWFTSSRYGVLKLSESKVINIFEKAGIDGTVVNAVEHFGGCYYCGTDKGLIILDDSNFSVKQGNLVSLTEGARVRSIYADSKGGLWICTYSDNGLIYYKNEDDITFFNTRTAETTGNRFRCITELSDGTIAAGASDGLDLIKDGQLIGTVSEKDGLANSQILSIAEGVDGRVWLGTDGAGIYILSSDKTILKHIGSSDGLSSDVIMKIAPHDDGELVITSNSLCHVDKYGNARKINNFPYFNNYDVLASDDDTAYITCSAGIYKVDYSMLCADKNIQCRLYSANDGLVAGLTPNSRNYISDDGRIFLCTNSGVTVFLTDKDMGSDYKFGVTSIEYGDEVYTASENNLFKVPKYAKEISVHASVRTYSLSDIKVRFFEDGRSDTAKLYDWDKIEPVIISDMSNPEHLLHFQVFDASGAKLLEEMTYLITRETQLWEKPIFIVYLVAVCIEVLIFTIVSIVIMVLFSKRKRELENLRVELAEKVDSQTKEIKEQQEKTEKLFLQTVSALSGAVDAKDRYTSGHSQRVAEYARIIAARMGKSAAEQEEIYRAGLLHDIGKIRVPGEIINKPGKLTNEEYELIKIHPVTGYHILRNISGNSLIAVGAKFHHERYDGKGYPNGIAGKNIPEVARILGVADAYDAMASNRSYRNALPQEIVREEIVKCRGTQFDPDIADTMLRIIDEDKMYLMKQGEIQIKRTLVIDDEQMYFEVIKEIMQDNPMYEMVYALGGEEGLEKLASEKFDLVLLDLRMPGMDGLEVLRRIREKSDIPVVLMTADKNIETLKRATELGSDDYIAKPFQPLLLKEVIHSMSK